VSGEVGFGEKGDIVSLEEREREISLVVQGKLDSCAQATAKGRL
jgi:hypothetical protein